MKSYFELYFVKKKHQLKSNQMLSLTAKHFCSYFNFDSKNDIFHETNINILFYLNIELIDEILEIEI